MQVLPGVRPQRLARPAMEVSPCYKHHLSSPSNLPRPGVKSSTQCLDIELADSWMAGIRHEEVVLIAQPLSEPQIDTPALFELDPAMGSGGHSAQPVLCVSDTTLMEDALLAQGVADHKGHAVAIGVRSSSGNSANSSSSCQSLMVWLLEHQLLALFIQHRIGERLAVLNHGVRWKVHHYPGWACWR